MVGSGGERVHCSMGVGAPVVPPCDSLGSDLHPLLFVAVDDDRSATQFDAPIVGNVDGVLLAGEELRVIHASALGGGAPGSECHLGCLPCTHTV